MKSMPGQSCKAQILRREEMRTGQSVQELADLKLDCFTQDQWDSASLGASCDSPRNMQLCTGKPARLCRAVSGAPPGKQCIANHQKERTGKMNCFKGGNWASSSSIHRSSCSTVDASNSVLSGQCQLRDWDSEVVATINLTSTNALMMQDHITIRRYEGPLTQLRFRLGCVTRSGNG